MNTFEALLLWAVIIAAYWAPTVVAFARHIPNKWQIMVVNFFGFVLGVGWIVALVWALKPTGAHESGYREPLSQHRHAAP
jgi:purine-cytosine permease-like protein